MRSTTERIKLAKKQADEIKKQRNEKRHRLAVISCYSFACFNRSYIGTCM